MAHIARDTNCVYFMPTASQIGLQKKKKVKKHEASQAAARQISNFIALAPRGFTRKEHEAVSKSLEEHGVDVTDPSESSWRPAFKNKKDINQVENGNLGQQVCDLFKKYIEERKAAYQDSHAKEMALATGGNAENTKKGKAPANQPMNNSSEGGSEDDLFGDDSVDNMPAKKAQPASK